MSESQVIVYESKRTNVFARNVMFVSIIFMLLQKCFLQGMLYSDEHVNTF